MEPRDPRLRDLSSDHHHALVLARDAQRGQADWERIARVFGEELDPHFRIEEQVLLPPLREHAPDEVARTLRDHAALRHMLAEAGDVIAFGERLKEHVRFEERVLFPTAQRVLPDEVLDEVAARCAASGHVRE